MVKVSCNSVIVASIWIILFIAKDASKRLSSFPYILIALKYIALCILWCVFLLLLISFFADFCCYLYFKQRMSIQLFFVLFETNFNESKEFIRFYFDKKFIVLIIGAIFPFLIRFIINKVGKAYVINAIIWIYITFLLVCVIATVSYLKPVLKQAYDVPSITLAKAIKEYIKEIKIYREIKGNLAKNDYTGEKIEPKTDNNLAIFVIGESTNRNHMGVYGYYRDTTPRFDKIKEKLYIFNDVISPHSHTIAVFKKIFTFKNNENSEEWYEYPTLIDCFKTFNYKAYWISNQEISSFTGALSSQADVVIFNDHRTFGTGIKLDSDLLDYVENIVKKDAFSNKLIIIHLMGSHAGYSYRYPDNFNRFNYDSVKSNGRDFLNVKKKQIISEYDNSILFQDYVLYELIKRIESVGASAYILFVSDHGEEVFDNRDMIGHTELIGNRNMIEVPFILWFSEQYEDKHPSKVENIKTSLSNPYMTDDLIHTILDLSSLNSDLFDPTRSVINRLFNKRRSRIYGDKDYDKEMKNDNGKSLIVKNYDKIWAHRVNSTEKLKLADELFKGVEVDIILENDGDNYWFDVNHPPAESIDLKLEVYLESIKSDTMKFWFDLKNLTERNVTIVESLLSHFIDKFNLKGRYILESSNYMALKYLSESGIFTSYYLPYLKLNIMTDVEKTRKANQLIVNIKFAKVNAVSFPGYLYGYVKEYILPNLKDIDVLLWFTKRSIENLEDAKFIQKIVNEEAVNVVLVKYKTKYDR